MDRAHKGTFLCHILFSPSFSAHPNMTGPYLLLRKLPMFFAKDLPGQWKNVAWKLQDDILTRVALDDVCELPAVKLPNHTHQGLEELLA